MTDRTIRRLLAARSKELLDRFRRGEAVGDGCPLRKALCVAINLKDELLDFLRHSEAMPAAKALLKRTFQEFVLEYGWWYEPAELDVKFATGTPQQCHQNATDLALADDTLIYCEGIRPVQEREPTDAPRLGNGRSWAGY